MRLTCPNCDAHYEVDARAIPPEGRDVQCSSCGHLWFEPGADVPAAVPADVPADALDDKAGAASAAVAETFAAGPVNGSAPASPPAVSPAVSPAVPPNLPGTGAVAAGKPGGKTPAAARPEAAPDPDPDPAPDPAPRRKLDASVAALLREEAEREAEARRAERAGLESQPDLGLDRLAAPRRVAPRRVTLPPTNDPMPRSAMLPDIDANNATLHGDVAPAPEGADEAPAAKRSGGFARGFALIVVLAALLFAGYVQAPALRAQVPAAGPALDVYVATVDGLRRRLDALVRDLRQSSRGAGNS